MSSGVLNDKFDVTWCDKFVKPNRIKSRHRWVCCSGKASSDDSEITSHSRHQPRPHSKPLGRSVPRWTSRQLIALPARRAGNNPIIGRIAISRRSNFNPFILNFPPHFGFPAAPRAPPAGRPIHYGSSLTKAYLSPAVK